ncbi:MAG: TIM barrel protein [Candidatus Aminicenantes bacterium]|nr:TIM barrel protein [Candidatus Aminicenantes bacterium]
MRPYSRRKFLGTAALGAAALAATPRSGAGGSGQAAPAPKTGGKFKLKYAPSLGMFEQSAGKNPVDQIKFIADQGFRAIFDNGLMGRPPQEQEAIARELGRLGLDLGPFVAYADFQVKSFVTRDSAVRQMLEGRLRTAVECAKRTGAKQTLVVPGRYDERLEWDYQTANVVENLKWAAGIADPAGLVIVIEPLNPHDHPGLFLTKMPQAYQICRAVGSPACKIVEDIYHQQITEGNIIPNIDGCWDEIAAFHCGDTPGRKEPGTGELNYRMIFKHLQAKKYVGVICMEHGKSRSGLEGEKAVIEAYRACDNF